MWERTSLGISGVGDWASSASRLAGNLNFFCDPICPDFSPDKVNLWQPYEPILPGVSKWRCLRSISTRRGCRADSNMGKTQTEFICQQPTFFLNRLSGLFTCRNGFEVTLWTILAMCEHLKTFKSAGWIKLSRAAMARPVGRKIEWLRLARPVGCHVRDRRK